MSNLNIVFVSCTENYPHGFSANNTKMGLLAKGLIEQGNDVTFINKYYGGNSSKDNFDNFKGIHIFDFKQYSNKKLTSLINLVKVINRLRKLKTCKKNVIIITGGSFIHNFFIVSCTKFMGYKSAMLVQEYIISQKQIDTVHKINGWIHLSLMGCFVDFILPISEFLIEKMRKFHKPYLKLPICADFETKNSSFPISNEFVYCASSGYYEAACFVIASFELLNKRYSGHKLCMILSGDTQKIARIQNIIDQKYLNNEIYIQSKLSYSELINKYSTAKALLIPQNPTHISEIARFSQKIAEYLSVGRPIISNNTGEIKYYFTNHQNMLIVNEYTPDAYSEEMMFVIEHPEEASLIGHNGYLFGKDNFSYKILSRNMINLFTAGS